MIELKLKPEEVNVLLTSLGNMPYVQVSQLIQNVLQQANAQTSQQSAPEVVTGELVDA